MQTCAPSGPRLAGGTWPPCAEDRGVRRRVAGFEEELPESGVGQVLRHRRERELDEARDLDLARTRTPVRHGEPAHLDVVLRRDGDLELRLDAVVDALEQRAI